MAQLKLTTVGNSWLSTTLGYLFVHPSTTFLYDTNDPDNALYNIDTFSISVTNELAAAITSGDILLVDENNDSLSGTVRQKVESDRLANYAFISSNIKWQVPKNQSFQIRIPLSGYFDAIGLKVLSSTPLIQFTNLIFYEKGVEATIFIDNSLAVGNYPIYVYSGNSLNDDLPSNLSTNAVDRIETIAAGGQFLTIGYDNLFNFPSAYTDYYDFFDHFNRAALGENWIAQTFGGGATIDMNVAGEFSAPGIVQIRTGTANGGRVGFIKDDSFIETFLDCSIMYYKAKVKISTLYNAASPIFYHKHGFLNSNTSGNSSDMFCFVYDEGNLSVASPLASPNWLIQNRVNGVDVNVIDTGIPVVVGGSGEFVVFEIIFDRINKRARGYIDGVQCGEVIWNELIGAASNLPMTGPTFASSIGVFSQNGTTSVEAILEYDYIYNLKILQK